MSAYNYTDCAREHQSLFAIIIAVRMLLFFVGFMVHGGSGSHSEHTNTDTHEKKKTITNLVEGTKGRGKKSPEEGERDERKNKNKLR